MSSKAERQLKELRRLMPWTWDARVEKHPPGEKALKDFENVLSIKEQPRTRKTGSATKTGGPGSSSVNGGSSGPQHGAEPTPHSRRPEQQQPGERRSAGKRHSPSGQPSLLENADAGGSMVARLVADGASKRVSLPGRPSLDAAEQPVEATPAVPRTRGVQSPTAFLSGKTPATSVGAGTPDSALLHTGAPSTVLASCAHNAALTGAHFKPTPGTVATAARPTTAARPSGTKAAAGSAFHPLRLQLLPGTEKAAAAVAAKEEEEEADQDVTEVAVVASAPAGGADRKAAAAEAAAAEACTEGGVLATKQAEQQQQQQQQQQQREATQQQPVHHEGEGRLDPPCPKPLLGRTDSDLTTPAALTAVIANPAAANVILNQGGSRQQQQQQDPKDRLAVRHLGSAPHLEAASRPASVAAAATAGEAVDLLLPILAERRLVVVTSPQEPAAPGHPQERDIPMAEAAAANDNSSAPAASDGCGCGSRPLAAAAAAMSRPSNAPAESAPATLATPAVAEGSLLEPPQLLLCPLPAPKPTTAGSSGAPVLCGASLPAEGPAHQQRQQQKQPSGHSKLPRLELTGLETATPPQGLLPEPPVLAMLHTFQPLQHQLQHQPLVREGRVPPPPQQEQQGSTTGCAPAEAAIATNPSRRQPPLAQQQQHGKGHLKPAGGISKPPRKHAGKAGAKGGRRSPSVLAQVLSALSQLPAVASPRSCHQVQPPAPALPLFRAGSLPQDPTANTTTCLRRTQSDAGAALPDLQSLLTALPKAPLVGGRAAAPGAAAAAAARSVPAGAEAGACPPLFKQRVVEVGGRHDHALKEPAGLGQQVTPATTAAGVAATQVRKVAAEAAGCAAAAAGEAAGCAAAAAAAAAEAAGPEAMEVDTQAAGEEAEPGPAGLGRAPMVQYKAQHSKGAAAALGPLAVDKENRCSNAATAARPSKEALPLATSQPRASSDAAATTTSTVAAATTASRGEQLAPTALTTHSTHSAGGPASEGPLATTGAAAAAARKAAAAPVQLSAWRLQQLDALSRAQHARERKLLRALAVGRAGQGGSLAHASPAAAAPPAAPSGLAGPPLGTTAAATAGFLLPPLPRQQHPSQPGRHRIGSAAGSPSGGHGLAEGRLAVSAGRVSKACLGSGGGRVAAATHAGRVGRELVMGAALARACTLLLQSRVTDWGRAAVVPWVH